MLKLSRQLALAICVLVSLPSPAQADWITTTRKPGPPGPKTTPRPRAVPAAPSSNRTLCAALRLNWDNAMAAKSLTAVTIAKGRIAANSEICPDLWIDVSNVVLPDQPPPTPSQIAPLDRPAAPPAYVVCNRGPYIIFFDWEKADITPESSPILDASISAYGNCDNVPITITGHTDGSESQNSRDAIVLSNHRTSEVIGYFTRNGVSGRAITTYARGFSTPRVPTPDGYREFQNRRVEIIFGPNASP